MQPAVITSFTTPASFLMPSTFPSSLPNRRGSRRDPPPPSDHPLMPQLHRSSSNGSIGSSSSGGSGGASAYAARPPTAAPAPIAPYQPTPSVHWADESGGQQQPTEGATGEGATGGSSSSNAEGYP